MSAQGKPNPIVNALADAIGALRADHDMHELATALNELGPKAIEKLTPAQAREQPTMADAVERLLGKQGKPMDPRVLVPGITRESIRIPTHGGGIGAYVYTPDGVRNAPIVLFIHGGGWVIADAEAYDGGARGLAKEANAIVVSIDYRLAPEHKFPAAWDDCLDAYEWISANATSLGGDAHRLAIAGESAGGCMAVATAVAAHQKGFAKPRHIVAVYPVAQTGSLHTESYIENAIAKPLNRAMIEWFTGHLVNSDDELKDPRIHLVDANLSNLPPVTIINATIDPLRSDGGLLEDALKEAGVPVQREVYTGVTHEFFGAAAVLDKARKAQAFAGARLREAFGD
ncbi:alpha/beta hydrolase [Luteibacter yeojuensis]|uniref:Lipase n=1 Tax=Luteibacter yeojuensis TaxID=345309 RepID=A0A0F3K4N3_9GAMM|nr:alpha/beta hydrolase [Luteibacter yeojuensis]KJV26131.1 lipase [Luteibacter yeojuensis]